MNRLLSVACPTCAQQPQEDCAEWREGVGMVAVSGLVHSERILAVTFADAVSASAKQRTYAASAEQIARAIEGRV